MLKHLCFVDVVVVVKVLVDVVVVDDVEVDVVEVVDRDVEEVVATNGMSMSEIEAKLAQYKIVAEGVHDEM